MAASLLMARLAKHRRLRLSLTAFEQWFRRFLRDLHSPWPSRAVIGSDNER